MDFIKLHFEKILLVFLFIFFIQQCSTNKRISKLETQIKTINQQIDSVYVSDLQKLIEIEGLKTSKRTLYDWNAVVRTAIRPDDLMNAYDSEIEKIRKTK